jgi:hypothetical protein
MVILPWSSTGLQHLHPPFCCVWLFITIYFTGFYLVVLYSSSNLLPLSPLPALYSTTEAGVSWLCTWYFYQAIALGYDFFLHIVLFQIICLLIKCFLSFPPLHSVNVFLCLAITSVRIPSIMECLSLTALPSFQLLAKTLLADTTLQRLFTAHTLPYINSVLGLLETLRNYFQDLKK